MTPVADEVKRDVEERDGWTYESFANNYPNIPDPDQTYFRFGEYCQMLGPSRREHWVCTRRLGHAGHHVAHGGGNSDMLARWYPSCHPSLKVEEGL